MRNQFNVGNCTAWASTYYQFGYQVASKYSLDVNNNYNLFSPKWIYNIVRDNPGDSGSSYEDIYKVLSSNGSVRYSQFTPTTAKVSNLSNEYLPWYLNESAMQTALEYRVSYNEFLEFADINTSATPITSYNDSCLNNMKTLLTNGFILTFSTDFGTNNIDWKYGTLSSQSDSTLNGDSVCIRVNNESGEREGHAMAIVGYNDNITYDLNGNGTIQNFERGAFKIVNSHGDSWKNNGFVWLMYDALNSTSNSSTQNSSNRKAALDNYGYYAINVKKYTKDVLVKITLNHNDRTEIKLTLGVSNPEEAQNTSTMLLQNIYAESVNFSGTGTTSQDATFYFDFGDLYGLDTIRSTCYVNIYDELDSNETTDGQTVVKEIELIDSSGKTIAIDTTDRTVDGNQLTYAYSLGITGDVDNDTEITVTDSTMIQKYAASLLTLDNQQIKVADVNGDGKVTTSDATLIQKYIAGTIKEFEKENVTAINTYVFFYD